MQKWATTTRAVGTVVFCALGLQLAVVPVAASCPLPLDRGARWTYEGRVEWTVPGSASVKGAHIRWTCQVVDIIKGPRARAAIVRGFPGELAWYEPGQPPGFCVLLQVSNRLYRLKTEGEKPARALARQLTKKPRVLPGGVEELLAFPLTVGHKCGRGEPRTDTWYCWCVERVRNQAPAVAGLADKGKMPTYRLAYRTCPDHQLLDIVPGLGIVRFVYNHHGTVASSDVHLISFHGNGAVASGRRADHQGGHR